MQFEWFYIHCGSLTNRQMIAYDDEYSARWWFSTLQGLVSHKESM